MSRRTLILALLVLVAMAAPARAAQTIVSVQFDDGRGQAAVRALLARHHVQATFFINTGYVGTPDYFTWSQLHALAADGNEIAGHTLTHRDLASLSAPEQLREICGDRVALVDHGFKPVDFAYPFGSYTPAVERAVQRCGYSFGRAAWGLWGSGCEEQPATCPYAVDPAHLADPWAIPTADAPIDLTYVENQRQVVRNAVLHGGGWVQFFFHRICPDDCDEYSWTPDSLDAFLGWLESQRAAGVIDVRTMNEVLAPTFHPAVKPPAPPAAPRGANRLRNPSLERRPKGGGAPRCWERQGSGGTWSRVRGPHGRAEAVQIDAAPDAFAALATPQDQGECSPAVTAGQRLVLRASYRSLDGPRLIVWKRSKEGGWSFWRQSARLAPGKGFRRASWALPAVPRGVTALSVGISMGGDGRLAVDDLALSGA
jgi:peptidoglycan/xylan/chitin deacetylase (PgdA/CDA1 family)